MEIDDILKKARDIFNSKYPGHAFKWTNPRRNRIFGLCPEHYDTAPSFNIYIENGQVFYHCFGCGFSGKIEELSDETSEAYISSFSEENLNDEDSDFVFKKNFKIINSLEDSHVKDVVKAFLKKRGLTNDDVIKYNIHFCVEGKSPYFMYLGFPFYKDSSKIDFFCARKTLLAGPKYLFPIVKKTKKTCFYFDDNCEDVVLVEGVMDAIKVHKAGFNVMILFGKVISKYQLEVLKEYQFKKVKVFLDQDAIYGGESLVKILIRNGFNANLFVPTKKDPGDMSEEDILKTLKGKNRVLNKISGLLKRGQK